MKTKIIAISGKSGCGATTISKMIAEKLGYNHVNYTFKQVAEENNTDLKTIIKKSRTDTHYDRQVDEKQTALAKSGPSVLGSRLSIWLLKEDAFTVYLEASAKVRVKRITGREKKNYVTTYLFTRFRDKSDTKRFKKLYGIDNNEYAFADLIISVENKEPDEIVELIMAQYNNLTVKGSNGLA